MGEGPTAEQRHANRREVVWADDPRLELGTQVGVLVPAALYREPPLLADLACHRETAGHSRRDHARPILQPRQHVGEELTLALWTRVLRPVGEHFRGQDIVPVETWVHLLQPDKADQQQPGGNQEHEGSRDLGNGEDATEAMPRARIG